jgi:hypothetical protein
MMRRISLISAVLALLVSASLVQAQTPADAARHSQNHSRSTGKVYTNDNLPKDGVISVIGVETPAVAQEGDTNDQAASAETASANPEAPNPATSEQNAGGEKAGSESKADSSPAAAEPAQRSAELKKDAAQIKENISMLEREIDVSNREFRLRAATFYADAGNSLRNPKQWADQQRDHESEMKEKQAALDTAKQKLADLQEQARREGVVLE